MKRQCDTCELVKVCPFFHLGSEKEDYCNKIQQSLRLEIDNLGLLIENRLKLMQCVADVPKMLLDVSEDAFILGYLRSRQDTKPELIT